MRSLIFVGALLGCHPSPERKLIELQLQCGTDHIQSACEAVVRMMRDGCDRSQANMCGYLAIGYVNGTFGLPRDQAKAKELYARACTLGDEFSCKAGPNLK